MQAFCSTRQNCIYPKKFFRITIKPHFTCCLLHFVIYELLRLAAPSPLHLPRRAHGALCERLRFGLKISSEELIFKHGRLGSSYSSLFSFQGAIRTASHKNDSNVIQNHMLCFTFQPFPFRYVTLHARTRGRAPKLFRLRSQARYACSA